MARVQNSWDHTTPQCQTQLNQMGTEVGNVDAYNSTINSVIVHFCPIQSRLCDCFVFSLSDASLCAPADSYFGHV